MIKRLDLFCIISPISPPTRAQILNCPIKSHTDCTFKPLACPAQRTVQSGTVPGTAHAPKVAAADSSSSSDSAAQGNGRKSVRFKPWRRTKRCLSQR